MNFYSLLYFLLRSYYIAKYKDGKWEREIPFAMISYNVRKDIDETLAKELSNGNLVNELFGEITKEINFMRLLEKKIVNYLPFPQKFVLLHADYYQGAVKTLHSAC